MGGSDKTQVAAAAMPGGNQSLSVADASASSTSCSGGHHISRQANGKLRVDLRSILEGLQEPPAWMERYQEISRDILEARVDEERALPAGVQQRLRTSIDLGSGVYVRSVGEEPERVVVNVGMGLHVECGMDDTVGIVRLRRASAGDLSGRCKDSRVEEIVDDDEVDGKLGGTETAE